MPNFKYIARDGSGKPVNGSFEAVDYAAAVDTLRKQGLIIVSVNASASKSRLSAISLGRKKR